MHSSHENLWKFIKRLQKEQLVSESTLRSLEHGATVAVQSQKMKKRNADISRMRALYVNGDITALCYIESLQEKLPF